MNPVYQTIYGFGGNCFQACIASIFGLPIAEVPHFFVDAQPGNDKWTKEQWDAVREWSQSRSHQATWFDPEVPEDRQWIDVLESSELYYVAFGDSPRGSFGHCVVMRKGAMEHDPAGGSFIRGNPWLYVVFEPRKEQKVA